MKKFLEWLDSIGRKRIIMDRISNEPLVTRYYLFLKERERFPFNIFLHKFHKGDPGDVHDHPWPYFTLILKGGYYEWIRSGNCEIRKWRGPGHFRFCSATSYHRIELKEGVTPWTLFMPGPQTREWGFLEKGQWIPHGNYLKSKQQHNI